MNTTDVLDVLEAINSTRSMRYLKSDMIPDDVIWALIDAAIRGPSSGNSQSWGWVVVKDPATKSQIAAWYLEAWNGLSEPSPRRALAKRFGLPWGQTAKSNRFAADANLRSGDHLAHHIGEAPVWIVPVLRLKGDDKAIRGAEIYGAVQNLMLAARKFGIGSTLTMLHTKKEREISTLLGLPKGARTMGIIPLGYPARGRFSLPQRKPVDAVTHWDRWGQRQSRSGETPLPPESTGVASAPALAGLFFQATVGALTPALGLI